MTIHASLVVLGRAGAAFGAPKNAGILILGKSGAGKSDLALRLIAEGATLVADDRTELFTVKGALWGRAPAPIAGLIEARGMGILRIAHAPKARIALAVELGKSESRLPLPRHYKPPKGLDLQAKPVPLIRVSAFEASASAKIALAAAGFAKDLFRDDVNTI